MANDNKFHYPLSLNAFNHEYDTANLKEIYNQLRVDL
jgi:hypothetical protein